MPGAPARSYPAIRACRLLPSRIYNFACRYCPESEPLQFLLTSTRLDWDNLRCCISSAGPEIRELCWYAGNCRRSAKACGARAAACGFWISCFVLCLPAFYFSFDEKCPVSSSANFCFILFIEWCLPVSFSTDVISTLSRPHGTMKSKMLRSFWMLIAMP